MDLSALTVKACVSSINCRTAVEPMKAGAPVMKATARETASIKAPRGANSERAINDQETGPIDPLDAAVRACGNDRACREQAILHD